MVNSYIELQGMHRFRDDPQWRWMVKRFRGVKPTEAGINLLNEAFVGEDNTDLPPGIKHTTYNNKDRDGINTAVFEEHILKTAHLENGILRHKTAVLILADSLMLRDNHSHLSPQNCAKLWEQCGEDDIKLSQGRMDPVLKFFPGCQMMMVSNDNVGNGQANDTQAMTQKIVLKPGEFAEEIAFTVRGKIIFVRAVLASQIDHLLLRHNSKKFYLPEFKMKPREMFFTAEMPMPPDLSANTDDKRGFKLKGMQLPLVSNAATTGHKLQGSTVKHLFVHEWNYTTNWPYVFLSRVTKMEGVSSEISCKRNSPH